MQMSNWLIIQKRISLPGGMFSVLNPILHNGRLIGFSYSYKYIEQCVRQGRLVDLEAHRAGPSQPRGMGASNIPKKGTRSFFTLEDDQLLYDFLQQFENQENAPLHGNKIYQLFERRVFAP